MATIKLTQVSALPSTTATTVTANANRNSFAVLSNLPSQGFSDMATFRGALPAVSGARRLLSFCRPGLAANGGRPHAVPAGIRAASSSSSGPAASQPATANEGNGNVQLQRDSSKQKEGAPRGAVRRVPRDGGLLYPRSFGGYPDLWGPLAGDRSLSGMLDLMDRVFDDVFPTPFAGSPGGDVTTRNMMRTPWDVKEADGEYKIRIDMPGLKEEVKIKLEENTLAISGEHKGQAAEGGESHRAYASYQTRLVLPDDVDEDNIKAELADGVLYVRVPKKAQQKPQQKEIQIS